MATVNRSMSTGSGSFVRPIMLVAGAAAIVAAVAYGSMALMGGQDSEAISEDLTYQVSTGDLEITVLEDGELESAENQDVKCEVSGGSTIIEIVADGEYVEQGSLIIELDKSTIEDSINQQQNTYEKARATVIQAEQDLAVAEISIEEYQDGTFKQEQQDAEAQIKIAQENLRSAENALAHAQRMFRKGYVSLLELETQQFAVERSQLELDSAQTAYDVLVNFTMRKTLEDLRAQRDIAEANRDAEVAAFALEESKLERLREQLENCDIFAPADGMIVYSNESSSRFGSSQGVTIEKGAAVKERQSMIKIPDLAQMQVKVNVHESKVELLEPGMPALVRVSGREMRGYVMSIANQPEATSRWTGNVKEYSTIVRIEGQPEGLRPGMTAEVEILVANLSDVVKIPVSSVVETGGRYSCYALDSSGQPERRDIEIGMSDGEFVEIRSGIAVDDTVLRNPRSLIAKEDLVGSEAPEEAEESGRFGERNPQYGGGGGERRGGGRGSEGRGSEGRGGGNRGAEGASGERRGGQGGGRGGAGGGERGGRGGGSFDILQYDTDGDGKVSEDEAPEQMRSRISDLDTNGDGGVDKEEFDALMRQYGGGN